MRSRVEGSEDSVKPLGVRARAKQTSRDKIVMAARKLFAERGYDAATLRHIAKEAGLGLATLFDHFHDKRDLIYLIFDEEMDALTEKALGAPRPWQTFVDKILTVTEFHFRCLGGEPVLSRILLSEVLQETPGPYLERHLAMRARFIQGIEGIVKEAQASGELKPEPAADAIALTIFFAYSGAARWWIASPSPDWHEGQRQFGQVMQVITNGLKRSSREASSLRPKSVRSLSRKRKTVKG